MNPWPSLFHSFFLLVLSCSLPLFLAQNYSQQYTTCSQQNSCETSEGKSITIRYPFTTNGRPSYCGYPGLQLNCDETDYTLTMNISNRLFQVKEIDYDAKSIILVDETYIGSTCPQNPNNFTTIDFNSSNLDYRGDLVNITLLIECQPFGDPTLQLYNLSCEDNGTEYYAYYWNRDANPNFFPSVYDCEVVEFVMTQTAYDGMVANNKGQFSLKQALQQEITVIWSANDLCNSECNNWGGVCVYDDATLTQYCVCPNGLNSTNGCPTKNRRDGIKKFAIGVGVGAAVLLATLGAVIWFIMDKRKRRNAKQQGSSVLLSRSLSSSHGTSKHDIEVAYSKSNFGTPVFTYEELEEATDGFNDCNELGEGGFGTVYKGNLKDGRVVAIKRLYENNYRRAEQFRNEIEILSQLKHKNLVCLYGCTSRHSRELLLVYEFVANGTVADHLHGHRACEGNLTWWVRMTIAVETADALQYLHAVKPPIIHRDVKTSNILLDSSFQVKVADFGLSRLFPLNATHVSTAPQGTPGYVDPEYYQCYQLTDKSDVYSFGVVLMELISSKPAVDIERPRQHINLSNMAINMILNNQLEQFVDPTLRYDSDLETKRMIDMVAELAFKCLQPERDLRPSIKEVLNALRAIQSGETVVIGVDGKEDDCLLGEGVRPVSPNTVTGRWESIESTPNNSG